jgi:hypothetical protein
MDESDRVMMRSYMDALNDYERINLEAVAIARGKLTGSGVHPVDLDAKPEIAADTARDVMLRWHVSLIRVLAAWERLPQSHQTDHELSEQQLPVG